MNLVELLVGSALGLLVVSSGLTVAGGHLVEQRRLQRELVLEQELRAATALLVRDLRRSGFWWNAANAGNSTSPTTNPYAGWSLGGTAAAPTLTTAWAHPQRAEDDLLTSDERRGLRLRAGVLEMQLAQGNWQALTDANVLRVTALRLTPREEAVPLPCPGACPTAPGGVAPPADAAASAPACNSRLVLRHLQLELQVRSATAPALERRWQAEVRLRNDAQEAGCGA